jgi:hypothetical protein
MHLENLSMPFKTSPLSDFLNQQFVDPDTRAGLTTTRSFIHLGEEQATQWLLGFILEQILAHDAKFTEALPDKFSILLAVLLHSGATLSSQRHVYRSPT